MIAVVLGGAASVWDDLEKLKALTPVDYVIATNDAGVRCRQHLDHWVTLHPEKMKTWWDARLRKGHAPPANLWFHKEGIDFPIEYRIAQDWGGSSGLLAVHVGLIEGYDKIVLCGVPMENGPHFFASKKFVGADRYQRGWIAHAQQIAEKVRSMSGWTAQLLGEPDEVWLNT